MPVFTKMVRGDESDSSHFCVPVDEITGAKFTYYAAKILELLEKHPPPPP